MTTASASPSPRDAGRLGDEAAGARVAQLYRDHARLVVGLCRMLLRDASEAEDAAQATFLAAHRALLGGTEPREPSAWLASIARNECRARIRQRMRQPLATQPIADDLPDPVASAIAAVDLNALWRALGELPRRQRRAFLLRELSGLSYGELAAALGVTEPAVESLLFRARQQLRAQLRTAFGAFAPVGVKFASAAAGTALVAGGAAVAFERGSDRAPHLRVVPKPTRVVQVQRPDRAARSAPLVAREIAPRVTPAAPRPQPARAASHDDGGSTQEVERPETEPRVTESETSAETESAGQEESGADSGERAESGSSDGSGD